MKHRLCILLASAFAVSSAALAQTEEASSKKGTPEDSALLRRKKIAEALAQTTQALNSGSSGWKKLISKEIPGKHLDKILMKQIFAKANQSSLLNGYAPIRSWLAGHVQALRELPQKENKLGREILLDAFKRVDQYKKGAIPNYIYDGLATLPAPGSSPKVAPKTREEREKAYREMRRKMRGR